ncbi:hypothetical protein CVU37_13450 [candidate division BRC1 bacterium HGW-BRC1-1]|nr:MAG: hypothetical protein CVU37_13450 [candidate division BRC1 bacterium HGW-BRC1-1]
MTVDYGPTTFTRTVSLGSIDHKVSVPIHSPWDLQFGQMSGLFHNRVITTEHHDLRRSLKEEKIRALQSPREGRLKVLGLWV